MLDCPVPDGNEILLRVSQGFRYLCAWIDKWLTLKKLVEGNALSISTENDKVAALGGQQKVLPIRTTFQLWSSIVLAHVYSTIEFVSERQAQQI